MRRFTLALVAVVSCNDAPKVRHELPDVPMVVFSMVQDLPLIERDVRTWRPGGKMCTEQRGEVYVRSVCVKLTFADPSTPGVTALREACAALEGAARCGSDAQALCIVARAHIEEAAEAIKNGPRTL